MTSKDYLKLELMVFAIRNDYFGYGSVCKKQANGYWVTIVDGEKFIESSSKLASNWDTLEPKDKVEIINAYFEKDLQGAHPLN